jgi:hypothetical protein
MVKRLLPNHQWRARWIRRVPESVRFGKPSSKHVIATAIGEVSRERDGGGSLVSFIANKERV